jgi:hypothetical protein
MRWLLPLFVLFLTACPPDLCDRACTSRIDACGEEEQNYTQCAAECTEAGTWRTSYVECVEAAANCTQLGTCPK